MISNEYRSKPVDALKKRKHCHQDKKYDARSNQFSGRILTQDNKNDPSNFFNDNTRRITYRNAAVGWRPTKTAWSVRSGGTIGDKLDHAELVSGGEQVAETILSRMIDEELDEGELADIEDTHESMGRRPRLGWCKRRHERQPTAMAQATPEVVTDIEDWD